jgi:haloalkane dehalogenase
MDIFIELWKAKDAWKAMSVSDRQSYVAQIGPVMEDLISRGVVIEAWGINDDDSPFRGDYDYFAVTKFPHKAILDEFKNIVEQAKWYDYFEQVNITGAAMTPEEVIGKLIQL